MDLQSMINSQAPYSVLELQSGEFPGQVVVDRPLTIVGKGKDTRIGSKQAPAIRITSRGVRLKNLVVEVTSGAEEVAFEADPGTNPVLENVIVKGRMVGVPSEKVGSAVSLDEAPPMVVSSLPPPPVSPGAMDEEESELPQMTLEFEPPRPAAEPPALPQQVFAPPVPQSTRPRAKFVAAGVAALLAVGFGSVLCLLYERDIRMTELMNVERLTAPDKERIEREKRAKEREIEKTKAQERERKRKEQDLPAFAWNYPDEAKNMLRRAIHGDAAAQTNMGAMYEKGRGVPQDDAEAVKWYLKAAEQGHAMGQSNLGWMYARGRGIARDDSEAIKWIRKAAEQGNPWGQNRLGMMYEKGQGVPQDHVEAVRWFRKAAELGNALAQDNLGLAYSQGRGLSTDPQEAIRWFRKAAEQGHERAKEHLRKMGVPWP